MSSGGTHAPVTPPAVPLSPPAYVRPNSRFSSFWIDMRSRKGSHLDIAISSSFRVRRGPLRIGEPGPSGPGSLVHDLALDDVALALGGTRRVGAAGVGRTGAGRRGLL